MNSPNQRIEDHVSVECISDLSFDRLMAGEVAQALLERLDAHSRHCKRCQARRAELERLRDTAVAPSFESLVLASSRRKAPRGARRGYLYWLSAAAVFSLGLLGLRHLSLAPTRDSAQVRTKGSSRLGFYVKRGDQVTQGGSMEILFPGDRIQFTYTAPRAGYFVVLSRDGKRNVSVYYPNTERAAPMASGRQVLPMSTRLDDVLGKESIFALFCEQPIEVESLRASLEQAPDRMPNVSGCSTEVLNVEKRRP